MIDAFVARVQHKFEGLSRTSLGRAVTGLNQETLDSMSDIVDVYGCAWYIMISGMYNAITPTQLVEFYSNIPEKSLLDEKALQSLVRHLKDSLSRFRGISGSWNHNKIQVEDISRIFLQTVEESKFEFDGWMRSGASINIIYQPLGLIAEKFLEPEFFDRHASNVGAILNWDASFMDADNSKYKLMVIDRWPDIIGRIKRRFAPEDKKLPRFCYGFNDFYLLRPVAVSILRGKQVPNEIFNWFALWHFRRRWGSTPSDMLYAKAVCKEWVRFREVIYGLDYKRNHLFNCFMRMLHELKTVPLTREQLNDIYPSLIRAALKRKDAIAAEFLQII